MNTFEQRRGPQAVSSNTKKKKNQLNRPPNSLVDEFKKLNNLPLPSRPAWIITDSRFLELNGQSNYFGKKTN